MHRRLPSGDDALFADDVGPILSDLDRHQAAMGDVMDGMHDSMMDGTSHHGSGISTMWAMMGSMGDEMGDHRIEVTEAAGLKEMRAACRTHFDAIGAMLDTLDEHLDEMSCP